MKRTIAIGSLVATAGLLAAGLSAPAQAAPGGAPVTGHTFSAKSAWLEIGFWLANNGAALKDATEYHPDYKVSTHTARLKSTGGPSASSKPGIVAPIGEEGKPASKVKNINLPKTTGKVFFYRDGHPYWCSGTSVQSHYHNLVATAGHCVYNTDDDDHVLDHWVFVPGYYQGKAPWGIYAAKAAYVHYDFDVYEDFDRDYGFVSVYNGLKVRKVYWADNHGHEWDAYMGPKWTYGGKWFWIELSDVGRLGDNVGGQGFAYNIAPGKAVFAFGYPAGEHPDGSKPYTGITPKWCYGKTAKNVVNAALKIEEQIALKCAVTYGFDGAPWLYRYSNTKRTGYVNGVTSTFIDADGNDRYDYIGSPYFDGETAGVYATAANVWSGTILPPASFLKLPPPRA
jgi:hypothetical protein